MIGCEHVANIRHSAINRIPPFYIALILTNMPYSVNYSNNNLLTIIFNNLKGETTWM